MSATSAPTYFDRAVSSAFISFIFLAANVQLSVMLVASLGSTYSQVQSSSCYYVLTATYTLHLQTTTVGLRIRDFKECTIRKRLNDHTGCIKMVSELEISLISASKLEMPIYTQLSTKLSKQQVKGHQFHCI